MKQYLDLLRRIKAEGVVKADRTGTGTISLFGHQSRYDLQTNFPVVTTKKMFTRGITEELLWFLRGSTNVKELQDKDVHIWDQWVKNDGTAGPIYGKQWRHWGQRDFRFKDGGIEVEDVTPGRDQITELIERTKTKPDDRRLIVTAWNPDEVEYMGLPCCHVLFQCWTKELTREERITYWALRSCGVPADVVSGKQAIDNNFLDMAKVPIRGLSLQLYQRSCDVFLGVPFNITSYAMLTCMLAQVCGMAPLEFVHCYGDVHIYLDHQEQVDLQLTREPMPLPTLWLNPQVRNIDDFKFEDIKIVDYKSHPAIKGAVSV